MSQQFDRAAEDLGTGLEPLVGDTVRVDLEDHDDEFVLRADLPGFETDDIDLRVTSDSVHIDARRTESSEIGDEEGTYLRRERHQRSVSRSIPLPDPVDEDGGEAEFSAGVLTVTLPKHDDEGESIQIE